MVDRTVVRRALIGLTLLSTLVSAQRQEALDRLTIVAPAAPGGGWDQTARAMQRALEDEGLVRTVEVENVPGAAGTVGLAQFINAAPSVNIIFRALEHHVLEEMCETGSARSFVLRPDVIPKVDADDRR